VIFKRVGEGRPYPPHDLTSSAWASLPPRQVRLDELVTTKDTLQLAALLDEDSTFYGDLFAHVVEWRGVLHARVHRVVE
jgi:Arc/MetJ family transcription regulator